MTVEKKSSVSAHVNASLDLNSLKSSFVRTLASVKKLNLTRLQTKNNCVEFLIYLILEHFSLKSIFP